MPSLNRIEMPLQGMSVAEISGQWGKYFNFGSYEQFSYPQYDICKGLFEGEDGRSCKFDLIIADQVWSIWIDLILLQKNVRKMIKRGFYFYISSPFFIRFHAAPQDNSRWPARGLKTLLLECVFDESEIGISQWGNRAAALRNLEAERPPELDIKNEDLSNDPDFPITA
ncbi:dihydrolipoamide dehydrogenase [Planktotalea sp.]|uniref:dihydrolipoamide dehydrogenase n=1 Tax=Planktotalea sp. TaxID=2029877 RepID=UPI0025CDBCD3|nr:dihydrolipoamide dehydrogenase [Planktotalea sp.]